ncbi:MAG: hypothetical protein P4L41_01260 [Flavipsychrobacter sp.]|nr:hypothetical protein [Flavipsychrobacter sp.]
MRTITMIAFAAMVCATTPTIAQGTSAAGPHVVIYKTRANYRKLVPVTMNGDKTEIVSFPDPSDIKTGSGYPLPVLLHKGFLLDKRGIGKNTVFLKMTYMEYAKLETPPSQAAMLKMIKDKHPIIALYDCGGRYAMKDIVKEVNALIDTKKISTSCTAIQ